MNYLEILQNVLKNGVPKQPTRMVDGVAVPVENGTIGTFCEIFRHNMSEGFPLTTLRRMPFRSSCVELEGFIKGITDKNWYKDRKCNFWNEWANPVKAKELIGKEFPVFNVDLDWNETQTIETMKQAQLVENDLGPIYGYQWRKFGEQYGDITSRDFIEGGCCAATGQYQQIYENVNGLGYFSDDEGYDQLKYIVDTLKSNPYDRRMLCSAWNPNQQHMMALPSCHVMHQVVVYGNKLNLTWFQRSCDITHGVPNNISFYATLLLLYCEESGLEPGELVGILSDCHMYDNTINAAKELLNREERELPTVRIKRKADDSFSIFDWTYEEVELIGYDPHPKLEMGKVTV